MLARFREMFQATPKPPGLNGDGKHYVFKPSLVGGAREFDLTDKGLSWESGNKSAVWPLGKIAAIRLSYRPASMQAKRFRADIEDTRGERVTLYSTTWHTITLMVRQDDGYRAFIVELHRRLKDIGSKAVLVAGINPAIYTAGLVMMALFFAALAGLVVRALWIGQFTGAIFLLGFAALFIWQIGGFMKRNRPRKYTFDALPSEVLP
jgi:hypothetical protein